MTEKTDPNNFNESAGDLSAAQWMRDNLEAIAGYNADVEKNGVFAKRKNWLDGNSVSHCA